MSPGSSIGKQIRAFRKVYGFNQVELSGKLGIEPTYLSAIENDRREASITLLRKMSKIFKVDLIITFHI